MFCIQKYIDEGFGEDDIEGEIDVYNKQFGERFMLRLIDFRLKLQANLAEEGLGNKECNVSLREIQNINLDEQLYLLIHSTNILTVLSPWTVLSP